MNGRMDRQTNNTYTQTHIDRQATDIQTDRYRKTDDRQTTDILTDRKRQITYRLIMKDR